MNDTQKKEYGQFFSTKAEYLFSNFPKTKLPVVEPFYGDGDLVKNYSSVEKYDLFPTNNSVVKRNSLLNPPLYTGKCVITNPPFLNSNKTKQHSEIFAKWQTNDLYKCFIKSLITNPPLEGMIIVPVNFLSDRDDELRVGFFTTFVIEQINLFEEQVFADTTYSVCSIRFRFSPDMNRNSLDLNIRFFPNQQIVNFVIDKKWGFRIGGEIFEKKKTNINQVNRLVRGNKKRYITPLFLRALDGGSNNNRISLSICEIPYYGKISDRAFATITLNEFIKIDYTKVCCLFNEELENERKKYNSLFLTNYRQSTECYARKRIEFALAFSWIDDIINKIRVI